MTPGSYSVICVFSKLYKGEKYKWKNKSISKRRNPVALIAYMLIVCMLVFSCSVNSGLFLDCLKKEIQVTGCLQWFSWLQGVSPIFCSYHVYPISNQISNYLISTLNNKVYLMNIKVINYLLTGVYKKLKNICEILIDTRHWLI